MIFFNLVHVFCRGAPELGSGRLVPAGTDKKSMAGTGTTFYSNHQNIVLISSTKPFGTVQRRFDLETIP